MARERELDWMADAACKGEDTETFFPVGTPGQVGYERTVAAAKAMCRVCPVRQECLEYAVRTDSRSLGARTGPTGIFGGMTPEERAPLARAYAHARMGENAGVGT